MGDAVQEEQEYKTIEKALIADSLMDATRPKPGGMLSGLPTSKSLNCTDDHGTVYGSG